MEILREYILENSRTPFYRCSSESSPNAGDVVNIKGLSYEILGAKYDYEVWQSTGFFVYTCRVKQVVANNTFLQRVLNELTINGPVLLDAIDIINNAYPGGDVGDYMHDKTNYLVAVKKITISNQDDVMLFEKEDAENKEIASTFNLNFKSVNGVTTTLPKELFKVKLYWSSSFITHRQVFERDGKVDVLLQVVVPKGASKEFDNFIREAISLS